MKEFGSDFHRCDSDFLGPSNYFSELGCTRFYACGRHAIDAIVAQEGWKRIWIPAYFCNEVIGHIVATGIEVKFYDDNPLREDDDQLVRSLPYEKGDVLMRMNFFGLRGKRSNNDISVPVIEDHTHDLISKWTLNSNADFCIASIRKTIPVPEGGVLWSPKHHRLPEQPVQTEENISLEKKRWKAMQLKRDYLQNNDDNKNEFRELYIETENAFEKLPISDLTEECKEYLSSFNIERWYKQKISNWRKLSHIKSNLIQILLPENKFCNLFSFIFLLKSENEREQVRQYLIQNKLYPVVLWKIPEENSRYAVDFSKRMLSIPCDARYTEADIMEMRKILEKALQLTGE